MTEEQKVVYGTQGYLVVEGAFAPDELARVRAVFDRAAGDGGLGDLPNRDDVFVRLAEHPTVFPVVHRILGDDVQLRALQGMTIAPGGAGKGWHREVAGMLGVDHPASTVCVQVVFHLDDVAEDGACVSVVPGSHRFKPDLGFPEIARIKEMPHHVALRVKAGTAVVLHGNLWQARTRNRSETPQRFLAYAYVHCWMRQALPELSAHAVKVASSTHNLAQLFGLVISHRDARGYWGRKVEGYTPSTGLPERHFSGLKVVGKGVVPNIRMEGKTDDTGTGRAGV